LIIIPDRELFLLPFGAMHIDDLTRLMDLCTVSYSPSISSLKMISNRKNPLLQLSKQILLIGDPKNSGYTELPGTLQEVNEVEKIMHHENNQFKKFTGHEATKENLLLHLESSNLIHFSTHAVLDSSEESHGGYIVLTPTKSDSGKFHARDCSTLSSIFSCCLGCL